MTESNSRQVIFQNYANEMKAYMELTELYEMSLHLMYVPNKAFRIAQVKRRSMKINS